MLWAYGDLGIESLEDMGHEGLEQIRDQQEQGNGYKLILSANHRANGAR